MIQKRPSLVWLFSLLLLTVSHSHADTEYEKGWDSFKAKNYANAKTLWLPLAEKGDGDAALGLAIIFENGLQTPKDIVQSTRWYRVAADKGVSEAQHDLGIKYFTGSGVTLDYKQAYHYWSLAAESGLGSAQAKLAYLYLQGLGTKKNETSALRWYRQAADQGNTEGMYNLSLMYKRGTGVTNSDEQSLLWLTKAAEHNYPAAQYDLGLMMLYGKGTKRNVSAGKDWLTQAANNNMVEAQYYLGTLYMNGHVLRPNKDNAITLFTAAAKRGHKGAKQALVDIKQLATKPIQTGSLHVTSAKSLPTKTRKKSAQDKPAKTVVLNDSLLKAKTPLTSSITPPPVGKNQTNWVLQQNTKSYLVQLIASQDVASADAYLKKLPSAFNSFTYHFKRGGDIWTAVAIGIYADHKAASNAVKTLPAHIRKTKPWVRNIGKLQKVIRK